MKKLLGFALLLALVATPTFAASSLAVNNAAAMNGTNFGLQVTVDNSLVGSNSAFVVSDHPIDESHILFRFWIKPMPGFALSQVPNSNFLRIGYGSKDVAPQIIRMVIFLKKSVVAGNYRVNVWLRNDGNTFFNAGEFFLTSGATPTAQQIEFEYTQGTGSNNGRLIARKGGVQQFDTGATLDNDASPIGKVTLGFIYSPTDTFATASGSVAFDEYESYR